MLTLPQLSAMEAYWREFPPVHILLHMITEGLAGKPVGVESSGQPDKEFVPTPAHILLKEMGTSG